CRHRSSSCRTSATGRAPSCGSSPGSSSRRLPPPPLQRTDKPCGSYRASFGKVQLKDRKTTTTTKANRNEDRSVTKSIYLNPTGWDCCKKFEWAGKRNSII